MRMKIKKMIMTKNDCYKQNKKIKPKGLVVHSTGTNQTDATVFIKRWNRSGVEKCVHAFVDKKNIYQTLPFTMRCWGCGRGKKGTFNDSHIQFEICEDDLKSKTYFTNVYNKAVELSAYLCKTYNLSVNNVVCHSEAHALGYASNHADVMHWFPLFGKSMDTFRADVKKRLKELNGESSSSTVRMTVATKALPLICRSKPTTKSSRVGSFKKGTVLEVLKKYSSTWYQVKGTAIGGKVIRGYVAAKYLK